MVYGGDRREIAISVNGRTEWQTDLEFTPGLMVEIQKKKTYTLYYTLTLIFMGLLKGDRYEGEFRQCLKNG